MTLTPFPNPIAVVNRKVCNRLWVLASSPGSSTPEHKHCSCAGVEHSGAAFEPGNEGMNSHVDLAVFPGSSLTLAKQIIRRGEPENKTTWG